MNKLRILHLFNDYLPQTENWAYNLMSNLPGCEIHIGARNFLKNNFYNPQFHFIDLPFGRLDQTKNRVNKNSTLLKKIFLRSIPFIFEDLESTIVNYGKREKIQLVHAHFADNAWYFKNIARKLNVPFFISFYGWDYEKLPFTKPAFQQHFKELFKMADRFICEGNHGASILANHGCPKEKIAVVPLGIQPEKISFLSRGKIPNQLKLVQIASFTEKKGHQFAIEAVASMVKECPNIQLTFIGNDNEARRREKLEQLVLKLNLSNQVHFLPAIDYENLYSTLGEYDVFIHPSCYAADRDCEGGAPVVLLDAQATGMPVISTTHCDIPDEVIHQKTGLLSEEKNIMELAKNIKTFYQMDGKLFTLFTKNARHHVENNYNIFTNASKLEYAYKVKLGLI